MNVSLFGDTATPTTPVILSVIPAAYNQIDVSWSTSTDNVAIGGYQIYRDAVQIATTTLLSYSDTGLTGSTTYTYNIRAFDASFNYSFLSASSATTTSAAPLPPPTPTSTPSSGNPSRAGVQLLELNVVPDMLSAELSWRTNVYSRYTLRWGRTVNYELGFVSNEVFAKNHFTRITELEPNTVYEFEIIGYTESGRPDVLAQDQFKTTAPPDTSAPPNVSDLLAIEERGGVKLSWTNPADGDFSHVRILRSHLYFPTDPYDGFIVYQGDGDEVLDQSAFTISPGAYYTVFAYDELGNVSSGAVVYVLQGQGLVPVPQIPSYRPTQTDSLSPEPDDSVGDVLDEPDWQLDLADVEVIQNDAVVRADQTGQFAIEGALPTTIRIDYDKLPLHLKTITVTFSHPDDHNRTFSFLLRVNADKSSYESTIGPFMGSGIYHMTVSVIDFETNVVSNVEGNLDATYEPPVQSVFSQGISYSRLFTIVTISLLLALVLLLTWFLLGRHQNQEE